MCWNKQICFFYFHKMFKIYSVHHNQILFAIKQFLFLTNTNNFFEGIEDETKNIVDE